MHPTRPRFIPALLLILAGGLAFAAGLFAQDSASETETETPPLFFETVDVNVVNVEVIVTDRDGKAIRGLERDDFEVFEDGERVEISNFFAVDKRGEPAAAGAEAGDGAAVSADAAGRASTKSLLLVVFIDNLNLRPENRNRALTSLSEYLRGGLDPRDRVMIVVFDSGMRIEQNFTNEMDEIEATFDRLERQTGRFVAIDAQRRLILSEIERTPLVSRPTNALGDNTTFEAAQLSAELQATSIRNFINLRVRHTRATLEAIRRFADSLAGVPGRKAILYLSDGIPARPGEAMVLAWQNKYEQWASAQAAEDVLAELVALQAAPVNMLRDFRDLVRQATEQRVAFYPIVDSHRLKTGQLSAEFAGASTIGGSGAFSRDVTTLERLGLEAPLLLMAEQTGGVAFTQSSNVAGLLDRMVSDFSTFYSLGYVPPNPGDGEFHEIEVRVARDDAVVRHLGGHREIEPTERIENLTLSSLYYGFESNPLGIEIEMGQQNETVGGQYRIPLVIKFPFQELALLPHQGNFTGRLKACVAVRDAEGQVSPFKHIVLPIEIPEAQYDQALEATGAYQIDLVMRKGENRVAVVLRDEVAKIEATTHLDLSVGAGAGAETEPARGSR